MGAPIDAKMQRLLREGHDEVSIIGEMFDCMPFFKMLLDSGQDTMDELCRRFAGFYHYAKILETGYWGAMEQLWNAFHNCSVAPQHPISARWTAGQSDAKALSSR